MSGEGTELPRGWCWAKLGEVTENFDGDRIPLKEQDRATRNGPYPYYGAWGPIDCIDAFLFDGDYILIAEDGANLLSRTKPIAFSASGRFWVNNHAHVVRPTECLLPRFLELHFNVIDLQQYVTGSAQPKLTQAAMNRLPIALPPLNEQRGIVAKLDDLLARSRATRGAGIAHGAVL